MNESDFVKLCKSTVAEYANDHLDKTDGKRISEDVLLQRFQWSRMFF